MRSLHDLTPKEIESAVFRILGRERVRSVKSEQRINDDGAAIVKVIVVYDAASGLSVEEMGQIVDAIWLSETAEDAPFPVVDFREDTDVEPVAAE